MRFGGKVVVAVGVQDAQPGRLLVQAVDAAGGQGDAVHAGGPKVVVAHGGDNQHMPRRKRADQLVKVGALREPRDQDKEVRRDEHHACCHEVVTARSSDAERSLTRSWIRRTPTDSIRPTQAALSTTG